MVGGLAAGIVIGLVVGSALAGTPLQADLVETAVSVTQHGGPLHVRDVVSNRGGMTAPRSRTGYYLTHVRIGGRLVGRLRPGKSSRGAGTLKIPSSIAPGSYRLLACADERKRIPESYERNNCRAAPQPVEVSDRTPPLFTGLNRATTCIPGPVGGEVRYSHYSLRWDAAADNVTPASEIVYDVYQANTSGGESLSRSTYTTSAGATSFTTPLLPDNASYYFVVRARDEAGNHDTNKIERLGMNLCL
jgi:CARDB